MSAAGNSTGGVKIGNVSGGIQGSIVAGRDVSNASITVGGQPISATETPTPDQFRQLLKEAQTALSEITAQKDLLEKISAAAPFSAQGAEAAIKAAAEKSCGDVDEIRAKSMQGNLVEATSLLGSILDTAKSLAEKAVDVGESVEALIEKIEPTLKKVAVGALWVGRLWLGV